jgi:hypothetical protein
MIGARLTDKDTELIAQVLLRDGLYGTPLESCRETARAIVRALEPVIKRIKDEHYELMEMD